MTLPPPMPSPEHLSQASSPPPSSPFNAPEVWAHYLRTVPVNGHGRSGPAVELVLDDLSDDQKLDLFAHAFETLKQGATPLPRNLADVQYGLRRAMFKGHHRAPSPAPADLSLTPPGWLRRAVERDMPIAFWTEAERYLTGPLLLNLIRFTLLDEVDSGTPVSSSRVTLLLEKLGPQDHLLHGLVDDLVLHLAAPVRQLEHFDHVVSARGHVPPPSQDDLRTLRTRSWHERRGPDAATRQYVERDGVLLNRLLAVLPAHHWYGMSQATRSFPLSSQHGVLSTAYPLLFNHLPMTSLGLATARLPNDHLVEALAGLVPLERLPQVPGLKALADHVATRVACFLGHLSPDQAHALQQDLAQRAAVEPVNEAVSTWTGRRAKRAYDQARRVQDWLDQHPGLLDGAVPSASRATDDGAPDVRERSDAFAPAPAGRSSPRRPR